MFKYANDSLSNYLYNAECIKSGKWYMNKRLSKKLQNIELRTSALKACNVIEIDELQ